MTHRGDFDTSAVIYGKFTTYRPSTGAPYTLAGTPALSVYKDNSTTQSTSGVTLTADFDGVTGLNHFAVDTSTDGSFYAAGSFFDVVITTGTVDSVSAVGSVVASFTLRKNSALKPATAGRTALVQANGSFVMDGAGTLALSSQVDELEGRIPSTITLTAGGVTVAAINSGSIGSATFAADGITRIQSGLATSSALATVQADTDDIQTRLPAALVGGRMDASIGAMATDVLTASSLAASAVTEIQSGLVLTSNLPANFSAMSITASGTVAANVGGTVTIDTTSIDAIKAKTDQLTFTVANQIDANMQSVNDVTLIGDGSAGSKFRV